MGLKSGSKTPGRDSVGKITRTQLREIAEKKMKDLNANDVEAAAKHHRGLRPLDGPSDRGGAKHMAKQPKRIKAWTGDRTVAHAVDDAVKLVKANANAKFDESIEIAVNLGVDPRHADQQVRGVVSLPSGTGRDVRVAVIAKDAKAAEATAAGADIVGAEDLVERIQGGFMDFDRVIATPDMMALVGRLGKVLGPRGLMPNPRVGTVTPNVGQAVKDAKGGADRVPHREDRHHPRRHRQGLASPRTPCWPT